jgi:transposase InsO family protein
VVRSGRTNHSIETQQSSGPPAVGDITYVRTWEGWLYLSTIIDCFSRRVVGWAMADHLRTELPLTALHMALARRNPSSTLIHHTDRGCQPRFKGSSQHQLLLTG